MRLAQALLVAVMAVSFSGCLLSKKPVASAAPAPPKPAPVAAPPPPQQLSVPQTDEKWGFAIVRADWSGRPAYGRLLGMSKP